MSSYLLSRQDLEERELVMLADYAVRNLESKDRDFAETPSETRLGFQRDRDRVLHSKSFRRLKGKTQVFVAHHGDHFRSRLTHTLEVAQIARSLARILKVNEDLAETIALAHDLGHTPFGHAGEEAMRELMHRFGEVFEHNAQSRRIVEKLEVRSEKYPGLNLTKESREGLWKHTTPHDRNVHKLSEQGFLESQIVDLADEIAYQNHDLDDGLRSGILQKEDISKLELWQMAGAGVDSSLREEVWISQVISALINTMVTDICEEAQRRLETLQPKNPDDIRNAPAKIMAFSKKLDQANHQLRHFLYSHLYRSPAVLAQSTQGQQTIKRLFFYFQKHPEELPTGHRNAIEAGEKKEVIIKDFIAGMTDSFAIATAAEIS